MDLIEQLKGRIKGTDAKIVFPEGEDERVLGAAFRLLEDDVMEPIVLGSRKKVEATATKLGLDLTKINFIDPEEYEEKEELVEKLVERRKGKLDPIRAKNLLEDPNYFGTMLVYTGKASGMVSGAIHTTGETVKPALQIIKTKEGVSRTSGAYILIRDDEIYLMADCAINIDPDEDALAEIAVVSNETAKQYGLDPKIAMLSFSTFGSASHEMVTKMANATAKAKALNPDMVVDGELQFDAAFVPEVAAKKAPNSPVAGKANVFIFPSLEAGNIGYKIAQRFGGFEAIGPILQGLNAPVNDLSRGCNSDEVYSLAVITAAQAVL